MPALHISLDVQSLPDSVESYSALLGQLQTQSSPETVSFASMEPGFKLQLQQQSHCCIQGLRYIALCVSAEILHATRTRLERAGYFTAEVKDCCAPGGFRATDPTGHHWHVCAEE